MGEPNNALAVYMNRSDRIRDVLEFYLGRELPGDWDCREEKGGSIRSGIPKGSCLSARGRLINPEYRVVPAGGCIRVLFCRFVEICRYMHIEKEGLNNVD